VASPRLGPAVELKLESTQPTGSFKVRGALAALSAAPPNVAIVTASAGNHGLAVAWAASLLRRDATVVVPTNVSPAKREGLGALGAKVEYVGHSYDEAEAGALAYRRDGARYISPYNDTHVIAGQATLGLELDGIGEPITVVSPIGGGGLVAGLCCWARDRPEVRLIGVETEASHAMSEAFRAGKVVPVSVGPTLADGTAGGIEVGSVTYEIARDRLDDLVVVDEPSIEEAIRFLVREHGLIVEGAGAEAVAALLSGNIRGRGRTVGLLTGRNIAWPTLIRVLAGGREQARE
jgi:threonine dehydratase